jgi:methylenetetrahydrofolate dehydrogenase (NADP+)/methenyltetrahydrofolate cyclohydrolase
MHPLNAQIIDGKAVAAGIRADLARQVAGLAARGVTPGLHVVMVGDNAASAVYVRNKSKACAEAGIACQIHRLPEQTPQADLLALVHGLNADPAVSGVIVQLPLPDHMDEAACLGAVAPEKDVDGFHPVNLGRLLGGEPAFVPCTPAGVMRLLEAAEVPVAGRRAVVVGRGNVGLPLAVLLTRADATVTVCHSKTRDLGEITRTAEILVAAVGRPAVIGADLVRPGAAVIDVGINRLEDGRLAGDVDFEAVGRVAGWITPVPGGVGPMTVAMLLANTVRAAQAAAGAPPAG